MALTSKIVVNLSAALTRVLDLATGSVPLDISQSYSVPSGTGSGQADLVFHDQRTLGASATEDLDLSGTLVDAFGQAVVFAEVLAIFIRAASGNTNNVNVTRPAANGVPAFLAAGDGVGILPGGCVLIVAPGATGIPITAGTGDLLTITNSAGGTSVTYDVVIIGRSA